MDNASPQNLRDLKLLATAMIHDEGEKLSELCERLRQIASP